MIKILEMFIQYKRKKAKSQLDKVETGTRTNQYENLYDDYYDEPYDQKKMWMEHLERRYRHF